MKKYLSLSTTAVFILFYTVLVSCWLITNPLGTGPDEPEHYIRAVALGNGDLLGTKALTSSLPPQNATQAEFLNVLNRDFQIPVGSAAPFYWFCTARSPGTSAQCLYQKDPVAALLNHQVSYVGTYQPYDYLPAAIVGKVVQDPNTSLFLMRLVMTVLFFPLIVGSIVLLATNDRTSILGLSLALTPSLLFITTVLSPSSVELCAGVAVAACIIRLSRRTTLPRFFWLFFCLALFLLGSARPFGPLWLAAYALFSVPKIGVQPIRTLYQSSRLKFWASVTSASVGALLSLAWELVFQPTSLTRSLPDSLILHTLYAIPNGFAESIAAFGWDNILVRKPVYLWWGVMLLMVIALALRHSTYKEMKTLDLVILGCGLIIISTSIAIEVSTGWSLQGRYILPFIVLLPLWSGEILYRHNFVWKKGLREFIFISIALIQCVGLYSNGWSYAHFGNSFFFFLQPTWSPAFGWLPWISLVSLTCGFFTFKVCKPTAK